MNDMIKKLILQICNVIIYSHSLNFATFYFLFILYYYRLVA
jgi:hypothetical protein